jgi:hypothetical protein
MPGSQDVYDESSTVTHRPRSGQSHKAALDGIARAKAVDRPEPLRPDTPPTRDAPPAPALPASTLDDKIRGVLAFAIVIVFLAVTMTSALKPAIAAPIAFSLGAVGTSMVRPVIKYYFSRRIH